MLKGKWLMIMDSHWEFPRSHPRVVWIIWGRSRRNSYRHRYGPWTTWRRSTWSPTQLRKRWSSGTGWYPSKHKLIIEFMWQSAYIETSICQWMQLIDWGGQGTHLLEDPLAVRSIDGGGEDQIEPGPTTLTPSGDTLPVSCPADAQVGSEWNEHGKH